jgi:predicted amidophosphoribosyltransferase
MAAGIGSRLGIPIYENALMKMRETPELKDVYEYEKRLDFLKDVFTANPKLLKGKNILLFDDLYRSGATLNAATRVLYREGKAGKIYVLVLTRTRSKS